MIKTNERTEFLGQIIDIFEDWLEEKGILPSDLPNQERDEDETGALIYGSDYGELSDRLEELMNNWELFQKECE